MIWIPYSLHANLHVIEPFVNYLIFCELTNSRNYLDSIKLPSKAFGFLKAFLCSIHILTTPYQSSIRSLRISLSYQHLGHLVTFIAEFTIDLFLLLRLESLDLPICFLMNPTSPLTLTRFACGPSQKGT